METTTFKINIESLPEVAGLLDQLKKHYPDCEIKFKKFEDNMSDWIIGHVQN